MRRIACVLVMVFLFLQSFVVWAAESENGQDKNPPDIFYGKEAQLLSDLKIIASGGVTQPETVTRGEFAMLVLKALNYPENALPADAFERYADVKRGSSAFREISCVSQLGLMNGVTDELFAPEEEISLVQAAAVAVKMMNCDMAAQERGGYPSGYLAVAGSKGLFRGITAVPAENMPAKRSDIIILFYNTLHADMFLVDKVGGENFLPIVQSGRNLLTENFKIFYQEGIVTADSITALSGEIVKEGKIAVDDVSYSFPSGEPGSLIGRRVCVYYTEKDGERNAVSLYSGDNRIITLSPENILAFQYEEGCYLISGEKGEKKLSIGNNYTLIYNGTVIDGSDAKLMRPNCGAVTLISNDGDNLYEIVLVEAYYNLVVSQYDPVRRVLYDKLPGSFVGDSKVKRDVYLGDFDKIFPEDIELEKLAEGTVVSVYRSADGKMVRLRHSSQMVSGVVESIWKDGRMRCQINGETYFFSPDLRFDSNLVRVGETFRFSLDIYGEIADTGIRVPYSSGYVLGFAEGNSPMDLPEVNILGPSGQPEVYRLASRVKIRKPVGRGASAEVVEEVCKAGEVSKKFGVNRRGYIMYSVNREKEIREFIFPLELLTKEEYDNPPDYPLYRPTYLLYDWQGARTANYMSSINGFNNWMIMSDQTIVYTVPPETRKEYREEDVDASSIALLADNIQMKIPERESLDGGIPRGEGEIEVYKMGTEGLLPNVLVRYQSQIETAAIEDSAPVLVTDVCQSYDTELGVPVLEIAVNEKGTEYRYQAKEGFVSQVRSGDMIKFHLNRNNRIDNLKIFYQLNSRKLMENPDENYSTVSRKCRVVDAKVIRRDKKYLELLTGPETENARTERTSIDGAYCIVYEVDQRMARMGTEEDIVPGDTVVIYSRYAINKAVVIYKEGRV